MRSGHLFLKRVLSTLLAQCRNEGQVTDDKVMLAETKACQPTRPRMRKCDAFLVYPAKGRRPGIVFWPDALGLRDAKKAMARRLAAEAARRAA